MSLENNQDWYCPLYHRDIAEGQCLDINYERLGYVNADYLKEVTKATNKTLSQINQICSTCPNQPFRGGVIGE